MPIRAGLLAMSLAFFVSGAAGKQDAPSLADLAWLAGDWRSETEARFAQEVWLAPRGGSLPGVFRLFNDGELVVHEYILIHEEPDDVVLRFKHFDADYRAWETDSALAFRLVEARPGFALFENLAPSERAPDMLRYELADETLTVSVMDRPDDEDAGEPMVFRFRCHAGACAD